MGMCVDSCARTLLALQSFSYPLHGLEGLNETAKNENESKGWQDGLVGKGPCSSLLSLTPGVHMVEGESHLPKVVF